MKGKDAERGDIMQIKSWAYFEEEYDCHLTDGALSDNLKNNQRL